MPASGLFKVLFYVVVFFLRNFTSQFNKEATERGVEIEPFLFNDVKVQLGWIVFEISIRTIKSKVRFLLSYI